MKIGKKFVFRLGVEEYDGTIVQEDIQVYALGYTQALENLRIFFPAAANVRFVGEVE